MRILLANHTSAWSGGEVSLMRLVEALRHDHDLTVACPNDGPLTEAVERAGVRWLRLPEVTCSLRPHPIQTPVGLGQIASGGIALARAARRCRAEVIHANTPRVGLLAAIARGLGAPPVVVRAHEHLPPSLLGRATRAAIVRSAEAVAAVSDHTAAKFNEGLDRPVAARVYNSIDLERFDVERVRPAGLREELGLAPDAALLGEVAQITPWKGQDTAIRMLAELRRGGLDAHLALVGQVAFGGKGVRFDNHAFLRELEALIDELDVKEAVHFLGQRSDVPEVVRDLDLSLLPSWEEPFGLVTVESMALGTPPLVGDVGAGPELVQDRVTGRLLPPKRPELWAEAARELLEDRALLARLAERGPLAAARFRDEVHGREMVALYEDAIAASRRPQSRFRRRDESTVAQPGQETLARPA
jgi:L-malate glycosyltransferase